MTLGGLTVTGMRRLGALLGVVVAVGLAAVLPARPVAAVAEAVAVPGEATLGRR